MDKQTTEAVSPVPASIPSAPRLLQWSMDSGYLKLSFPSEMTVVEADEVEQVLGICIRSMKRWAREREEASAIEAQRAETAQTGSVEDESAVLKADAPNQSPPSDKEQ